MDTAVMAWDVCWHRPTGRRCLVVAVTRDGLARCIDGGDQPFECRADELASYRHPDFPGVLAPARRPPPGPSAPTPPPRPGLP